MKKLLACILAITLLLGSGIIAAVAAAPEEHSLIFILPEVTAIEAEWNGEIMLNFWEGWGNIQPWFSPANVEVTLHFEDGETQTLDHWFDDNITGELWWEVGAVFDSETGLVTVFFADSIRFNAFVEQNPSWTLDELIATLPRTTFAFPANFLELYFGGQAPTVLTLNQRANVSVNTMFTFTPQSSGTFYFYTAGGDYDLLIFDPDRNMIAWVEVWPGRAPAVWLEGGETYYIYLFIVDDWFSTHSVTVTDRRPPGIVGGSWIDRAVARWWGIGWDLQNSWWGRIIYVATVPVALPISLMLLGLQWIVTGRNTHSIFGFWF